MAATMCRVTAPVPGPTSRTRFAGRPSAASPPTCRLSATASAGPLGSTAPVEVNDRRNSRQNTRYSAHDWLIQRILGRPPPARKPQIGRNSRQILYTEAELPHGGLAVAVR